MSSFDIDFQSLSSNFNGNFLVLPKSLVKILKLPMRSLLAKTLTLIHRMEGNKKF